MNIYSKTFLGFLSLGIILFSCEEVIHPTLPKADPVLVVDAWINDKVEDQVIKLTMSQPYFENVLPDGVSGADVRVSYEGEEIIFTEDGGATGVYRWVPTEITSEEAFGTMGRAYTLTVIVNGTTYEAVSRINRTVPIDSITFKEDTGPFYPDDSFIAEFWATEPVGKGDTYWIRGYKNGVKLNKPSEINIAFDAGFAEGGNFDGVTFIPPIRGVNPNDVDEDDLPLSPYKVGDSLYVEIYSITKESFNFLNEVIIQTDRPGGFGELFATPLANVSTNITKVNGNGVKAVGFFNVSAVSGLGKKLE